MGALPEALAQLPAVTVVAGHYGAGKTNFALNLALDAHEAGRDVALADMDVVNPYFRSSDYAAVLEEAGVRCIAPDFAGTSLDTPVLSGQIEAAVSWAREGEGRLLVLDAGGDDVGATALGRIAQAVAQGPYAFLYVVNAKREQTLEPRDAAELLPEIERQARLRATAVVNNTHLQKLTTPQVIEEGRAFANEVCALLDMPLAATTVPAYPALAHEARAGDYVVRILVKTPWDAA